MRKNINEISKLKNANMLSEKTNQDYNKQKPNPNDPNQTKNNPLSENVKNVNKKNRQQVNQSKLETLPVRLTKVSKIL